MADLQTNYLDDILAQSMNGKRKYRITRADGTFEEVTLEDVSEYEQVGSNFGAGDINKTNQAVNEKFDSGDVVDPMLTTEPGFAADAYQTKLQFDAQNKNLSNLGGFTPVIDETGKITGYKTSVGGADTVFPFSSLGEWSARKSSKVGSSITIGENKHTLFTIATGPSGDVYACIYDLKNMKIIYKNDTAGIIAKSYVDGVVKTKWSDNDTDTSTFYYLYL